MAITGSSGSRLARLSIHANNKAWIFVAVAAIILIAIVRFSFHSSNSHTVSIQDNYLNFDLGDTPEGETVSQLFNVKNGNSSKPIAIVDVHRACSCITLELEQTEIEPGQSVRVKYEFPTPLLGVLHEFSTLTWHYADETAVHTFKFDVSTRVVNILKVTPSSLDFGAIGDADSVKTAKITLKRGHLNEPWDSLRIANTKSGVKADLVRQDFDTYDLNVSVDQSHMAIGPFGDNLVVTCFSGSTPLSRKFTIPISGIVTSNIKSVPATLYFGVAPEGQIFKKQFVLSSTIPLHLESIDSAKSKGMTTMPFVKDGCNLSFESDFNSTGLHGNQSGDLLVTVSQMGKTKSITVPFIVYVQ